MMLNKAIAAWGTVPDWIKALATACDETSLRKTAAKLQASPAIISLAINNKREDLEFIKAKVESKLMISIVACPVLGIMPMNECLQWQEQEFSSANPLRVQVYRACRGGCKYFKGKNLI